MMKETNFFKSYQDKDKINTISLTFVGESKIENYKEPKLEKIMDCNLNNFIISSDIDLIKLITIIRTITREYIEKNLKIVIQNNVINQQLEVVFSNKDLSNLFIETTINVNGQNRQISADYLVSNLNQIILNLEMEDESTIEDEEKKEDIRWEIFGLVDRLVDIKPQKLDNRIKEMCAAYKMIFAENPDFSEYATNIKMQIIYFIIYSGDHSLGGHFTLENYNGKMIPISPIFTEIYNELLPFGIVDIEKESYTTYKYLDASINMINTFLKDNGVNDQNKLDLLIKLSNTIYENGCSIKASNVPNKRGTNKILKRVRDIKFHESQK